MENFRSQGVTLCGDVLLISAFVSYVGYFTKKYRNELMERFWIPYVNKLKVSGRCSGSRQKSPGADSRAEASAMQGGDCGRGRRRQHLFRPAPGGSVRAVWTDSRLVARGLARHHLPQSHRPLGGSLSREAVGPHCPF